MVMDPLQEHLPNGDGSQQNGVPNSAPARHQLLSSIEPGAVNISSKHPASSPPPPPLTTITADLHSRVTNFLSEPYPDTHILHKVQSQTRTSLSVISSALTQYPLHELSLSYNGGKDCLVLLVLFLASLHPLKSAEEGGPETIPAIYAQPPHPFRSVEEFVASSSRTYHLSLSRYTTAPPHSTLRTTFSSYLSENPHIKGIFVGTRRTDPHGANLRHFDRTDHGWPDFMRIHPVIDWHYAEIWAFIRHLGIEYCPLYDEGYTSLGGTNDTHPNPKLKQAQQAAKDDEKSLDGVKNIAYRPAYELMDDDEERLGRM